MSPEISADPQFRERFHREAELVAALRHRNIVSPHRRGEHEGRLWILMDYIDGTDIGAMLQQRHPDGMPIRQVRSVVKAVAGALDYAHRRGLLHGDVRPSNILLTASKDGKRRILLSDFGLGPDRRAGEIDAKADQSALAATASYLLTGPSRERRPELGAVDTVLARAMSKNSDDGFDSCSQFADALDAAVDTPSEATQAVGWRQRWSRRPVLSIVLVVLAVMLVGGGAFVGTRLAGNRLTVPPSTAAQPTAPARSAPTPSCGDMNALLSSMTIRDKLAQLLMVGVTGADDAQAVVANDHVGGIFIASWTDLTMLSDGSLTALAKSSSPLPLAVSVDEEGGRVSRLSDLIGTAPSARELARFNSPEAVYQHALERGRKMREYGITIDFAPVVDVTDAASDTVIGDRSFSDDPDLVTQYAGEYARGLREAGLLPVLKHFPGHGRASGDSHQSGVETPPLESLQNYDLVPYRTLVAQKPVGVMVGHMQVPDLTGSEPASLSKAAIDLLRNGSGYRAPPFDGPVFTDDLSSMRAITDHYGVVEAVFRALQAGADTALWVSTAEVPAVLDRLESAVASGELDMASVDASVRRMAIAKTGQCGR